jgi:enoyl-CoA hydratase/carnithine racemase
MARKPVIASVQGNCIGLGTHIVLGCDFAIASNVAGFGFPEERFGGVGASWVYPYLMLAVGPKRATELVMTGRRVAADEAAAMGLITRVVEPDDLEPTVSELVAALSTLARDALAINRAARRVAMESAGYLSMFGVHAMNALSQLVHHEEDEFDFVRSANENGIRAAITERNELVAGSWWGW